MGSRVWVTYQPGDNCSCWRDAVCTHGWTWRDDECHHRDEIVDDVHVSLADAVRSLFSIRGAAAVGCLLRQRYEDGSHATMTVFVMPAGVDLVDDHDASGPPPFRIIERKWLTPRSKPGDASRVFANEYRDLA